MDDNFKQELRSIINEELNSVLEIKLAAGVGPLMTSMRELKESTATRKQVSQLITTMDGIAKRISDDDEERAAIGRQLERHQAWIEQLAEKTGTKLSYE